jgi:hypothetical protein
MTEQFPSNATFETTSFEVRSDAVSATASVNSSFYDAKAIKAALCEMAESYLPKMFVPSLRDLPRSLRRLVVPESFSNFRSRKFPRMAMGVR